MTKSRKDSNAVENSDSEEQLRAEKKLKKDKKHKKDKKDKKDKKTKKDKKEKKEKIIEHPEILVHADAGSDVHGEDSDGASSGKSGEFVAETKAQNADYKDLLFGERKRAKSGMSDEEDATHNYLNQRPYSDKYFKLLEVRKNLPAWQAKKQIIELVQKNQVLVLQGDTGSGKTTQVP
jgi:pre-mRNA-splicing factor ATP-dependent RNA helicase DHX15/PRP43